MTHLYACVYAQACLISSLLVSVCVCVCTRGSTKTTFCDTPAHIPSEQAPPTSGPAPPSRLRRSVLAVGDAVTLVPGATMNTSDSEEDSYNERSALVPSENPVVPSYRPDPDLSPPSARASKQVTFD